MRLSLLFLAIGLLLFGCAPATILRADIESVTAEYLPSEQVKVAVTGVFASRCSKEGRNYSVRQSRNQNAFVVDIFYKIPSSTACLPTTYEFEDVFYFDVGALSKGTYTVSVNGFEAVFAVKTLKSPPLFMKFLTLQGTPSCVNYSPV